MPKGFRVKVQFLSNTYIEEFSHINQDSTVKEVQTTLKQTVNELRTKEFTLSYSGNDLTDQNKRLREYINTRRKLISLHVTVAQVGGTQKSGFPEDARGDCQKQICTVFGSKMNCIKMDCGHWFSWKGLKGEVKRQYLLHKSHKLGCFKCDRDWDSVSDIIWLCNFNDKDTNVFEKEFIKRKKGEDCSICPSCGNMGKREITVKLHRLACGVCGLNYCLHCETKWTGTGMILCGNKECVNYDIQDQLNNCKLLKKNDDVTLDVYKWIEYCGENIPTIRACPSCLCIIRFKEKCQHMTCPSCEHEFCYICLANWKDSNGKQQHSYVNKDKQCKTAPRQQLN